MFDEGLLAPIRFSPVVHLVAAMRRLGLLSEEGLSVPRDAWDGVLVDDTMSWPSLHQINVRVIGRLAAAGPGLTTDEDRRAVCYVLEHWIFPLSGLDLTMAKVDVDDLKRQRDRWLARELGIADEFGWDYGPTSRRCRESSRGDPQSNMPPVR